jgi:hypothetical protein
MEFIVILASFPVLFALGADTNPVTSERIRPLILRVFPQ